MNPLLPSDHDIHRDIERETHRDTGGTTEREAERDTARDTKRDTQRLGGDLSDADDDALMAAYARSGDASAFERLYARHRSGLYRFVRRLLGPSTSAALVEEVYQDTWLRVVHARARWQPRGATFRTWLFTMAHHRAVDVMRRGGREVSLEDSRDDDSNAPFEPAGTPWSAWPDALGSGGIGTASASHDDALFWRRAGAKLLECLGQLPLAQRAVFLLHHEDGETVDAIARTLDVGFETAKSRLRYAMSKLRVCMGAYLEPMQALGAVTADLGSAAAPLGSAAPALGSAVPPLGSAAPALGSAAPPLGSATATAVREPRKDRG